ncbi:BatD family protein [Sulfuriroseicoccus oceanibius]|uniref:BatD family protein n=1 Tax=Sulfuriroseicoccus oceanibius TaxID=2707525 RepID=A0A6B3LH18_9BACT|nr:BatD family protein [Sulfuriroseicoccus oceanibius]QQL45175.1 BatD family protein [Sulfuriroseicoccus oceanibius]
MTNTIPSITRLLAWVAAVIWCATLTAIANPNDPEPKAELLFMPEGLTVNQRGYLRIRIPDARPVTYPEIPSIPGLNIRRIREGQSFTNGQSSYDFLYQVTAMNPVATELPPIKTQTRDGDYWTPRKPLKVRSNDHLEKLAANDAQVFLDVWTPTTPVYQRQSFPMEIALYTTTEGDFELPNTPPTFRHEGFSVGRIERGVSGISLINGKQFNYTVFNTTVTPVHAGTLTLEAPSMDLALVTHRASGFFAQRDTTPLTATGADHSFEVKELPPAPPEFCGAVGRYTMNANLIHTPTNAGDAVELELLVRGDGDPEFVTEPKIQDPEGAWKTYNMGASRTVMRDGSVVFNKVLRPTKPTTTLPSFEFGYFNPDEEEYVTLSTDELELPWDINQFPDLNAPAPVPATTPGIPPQPKVLAFPSLESPSWVTPGQPIGQGALIATNVVGAGAAAALIAMAIRRRPRPDTGAHMTRSEALQHLRTAGGNGSLAERLHALITVHDALDSPPTDTENWALLRNVHDRLTYNTQDGTPPSQEEQQRAAAALPAAIAELKRETRHLS